MTFPECPSAAEEAKYHSRGIPVLFGNICSCLLSLYVGVVNPELQCYFSRSTFFFYVFISCRVFLRAVNQFTSVLNRFFLDQANFELQVTVRCFWISLVLKGRKNKKIPALTDAMWSVPLEIVHSFIEKQQNAKRL